jgi:serine/threonine protein phosphatase PrpC
MSSHQLHLALGTHRGRLRERNEDAVFYYYPSDYETLNRYGTLFVVADGVGGLAHGAEVAEIAVQRLIEVYYQAPLDNPIEMLRASIAQINNEIYRQYHTKSATTLVAMLIHQEEAIVAHVGDSRAYHGRQHQLRLITQDHAAEMVDADGKAKRKLTRALGYRAQVDATITKHSIQNDDYFLLVTDGVSRYFDTPSLQSLLRETARESVEQIITSSNEAGGYDNVSAIVVQVGGAFLNETALIRHTMLLEQDGVTVKLPPFDEDAPTKRPYQNFLVWVAGLIGFLSIAAAFFLFTLRPQAIVQTPEATSAPTSVPAAISPIPEDTGLVGQEIAFEAAALTYLEIGQTSSAFLIEPHRPYLVQEIFTDVETWICLYEQDSKRSGWIREADLPTYRLLN